MVLDNKLTALQRHGKYYINGGDLFFLVSHLLLHIVQFLISRSHRRSKTITFEFTNTFLKGSRNFSETT